MRSVDRRIRAHPRVPASFMVRILQGGRALFARARDLSMVGLSVDTPLPVSEPVEVAIPLPGERAPMVTTGRVTRSDTSGTVLAFSDLSWDHLFALARFVSPRL